MAIEHELPLISTIAIGLSLAFICGFSISKLRTSPVIGYLLAGIIIGPYTPGYVASIEIAHELSEIGIVLLMFGVGLHFSMADLMKVKHIAVTGALVRIFATTLIGGGLTLLWGWSLNSAIIYGLALSVASTVVLLRSLEEHKLQHSIEGHIAIGWLVVEDLVMILALVLIPVLAQASDGMGHGEITQAILIALGKAVLFAVVMGVVGRKVFPFVLAEVNKTGSRELFTLAVLVAAVGVAFAAATFFDVSLALGAFFAGMIINSSKLNEKVAERALPFQDAFAVLFFVAIGMLFNPLVLIENPLGVVVTSFIIIVCKFIITFAIVLGFSYAVKRALSVSSGLAQIGEFSFILVGMGVTLGMLPEEGRDLVLAGAFISIALNPVVFHYSNAFYAYIEKHSTLSKFFTIDDKHSAQAEKCLLKQKKHIIIVGSDVVGSHVIKDTEGAQKKFVVIDVNHEKVDDFKAVGVETIIGDAAEAEILEQARLSEASAVVILVSDPYETGRIANAVRAISPDMKLIMLASNDEELRYYEELKADTILLSVREIGHSIAEHLRALPAK